MTFGARRPGGQGPSTAKTRTEAEAGESASSGLGGRVSTQRREIATERRES